MPVSAPSASQLTTTRHAVSAGQGQRRLFVNKMGRHFDHSAFGQADQIHHHRVDRPGCRSGRLAICKCCLHAPAVLELKNSQVVDPPATIVGQMSALWLSKDIGRPAAKV
jgi:hypothetical protein